MDKKFIIVLVALVLSVTCTIGVTLAWLVDTSENVVNTFTVGNIEIDLNETDTDNDDNTKANSYKVVPGATVVKDPKVTVKANSENCWVYVKVVNNLVINKTTVATCNIDTTQWTLVGTSTNADTGVVTNLYRYNSKVLLDEQEDQTLDPVFGSVTYSSDIVLGEDGIKKLDGKTIVVTAYAHQSDTVAETEVNATACTWAGVTAVSTNG